MNRILFACLFASLTIPHLSAQEWNLERCIAYAKENNKELLTRKEHLSVVGYDKKIAGSHFIPKLSFVAETDYYWKIPVESYPGELFGLEAERVIIATGTTWAGNYGLNLDWSVIDVQRWQEIKLQQLNRQVSQSGYKSLSSALLRNVTASFYCVQIEKMNAASGNERLKNYKETHALLTEQFENGLIDKIALNLSANILAGHEEKKIKQDANFLKSLLELKYWMGFPLDENMDVVSSSDLPNYTVSDFSIEDLPDYKENLLSLDIAETRYKASKSYFLPKLSLVGNFGQSGFGNSFREFSKSTSWHTGSFIGVRLQVPIFSGRDINMAKRNEVLFRQTVLEFSEYQSREARRYHQIRLDTEKTFTILGKLNETVKLAEENVYLCRQKIEHGIIDMLQLKQVQQELLDSVERLNTAKLNYIKCYVELNYLQNKPN